MPNIRIWKSTGYRSDFSERNRPFIQDYVENLYRCYKAPLPTGSFADTTFYTYFFC